MQWCEWGVVLLLTSLLKVVNIYLIYCACVHAQLIQSYLTLCDLMDCSLPGSSVHGDSIGKNTGGGCMPASGDLSNPGNEPRSSALQAYSSLSEPTECKLMQLPFAKTWVGLEPIMLREISLTKRTSIVYTMLSCIYGQSKRVKLIKTEWKGGFQG